MTKEGVFSQLIVKTNRNPKFDIQTQRSDIKQVDEVKITTVKDDEFDISSVSPPSSLFDKIKKR